MEVEGNNSLSYFWLDDELGETFFFDDEFFGAWEEEENIKKGGNGVSDSRWELVVLEGTSVALTVWFVGIGEDEMVFVESGIKIEQEGIMLKVVGLHFFV